MKKKIKKELKIINNNKIKEKKQRKWQTNFQLNDLIFIYVLNNKILEISNIIIIKI